MNFKWKISLELHVSPKIKKHSYAYLYRRLALLVNLRKSPPTKRWFVPFYRKIPFILVPKVLFLSWSFYGLFYVFFDVFESIFFWKIMGKNYVFCVLCVPHMDLCVRGTHSEIGEHNITDPLILPSNSAIWAKPHFCALKKSRELASDNEITAIWTLVYIYTTHVDKLILTPIIKRLCQ